jgi:hypothetical protein
MPFDKEKFKALVLYIIWRAGHRDGFGGQPALLTRALQPGLQRVKRLRPEENKWHSRIS